MQVEDFFVYKRFYEFTRNLIFRTFKPASNLSNNFEQFWANSPRFTEITKLGLGLIKIKKIISYLFIELSGPLRKSKVSISR